MTRQEANIKIAEILLDSAKQSPDLRLFQLFLYLGITQSIQQVGEPALKDEFYVESEAILARIQETLKNYPKTEKPDHYKQTLEAIHSLMPDGCSKDFLRESIAKYPAK